MRQFVICLMIVFVLIFVYLPQPANESTYADPYLCPDGQERVKIFDSGWINIGESAIDEDGNIWGRMIYSEGDVSPDRWRMEVWGCPVSCEEVQIT